jgi:hypothetical protein
MAVKFDGYDCTVQIAPRADDNELRLKVMRTLKMNSESLYTARVFDRFGTEAAYQNGDAVPMFTNDSKRKEEIRNPRTKTTHSSEPPAQPRGLKRKDQPRVQKDTNRRKTRMCFGIRLIVKRRSTWSQTEEPIRTRVLQDGEQ